MLNLQTDNLNINCKTLPLLILYLPSSKTKERTTRLCFMEVDIRNSRQCEVITQSFILMLWRQASLRRNLSGKKRNDKERLLQSKLNRNFTHWRTMKNLSTHFGTGQNLHELSLKRKEPEGRPCGKFQISLKFHCWMIIELIVETLLSWEMSKLARKEIIIWTICFMKASCKNDSAQAKIESRPQQLIKVLLKRLEEHTWLQWKISRENKNYLYEETFKLLDKETSTHLKCFKLRLTF